MIKDELKSKSYNIFRFPLGDQSALSHSGEPLINQDHHKITIKHHTVPKKELKWCTLNTNSVSEPHTFSKIGDWALQSSLFVRKQGVHDWEAKRGESV